MADLHGPQRYVFTHRKFIVIDEAVCVGCGICVTTCPLGNIIKLDEETGKAVAFNPMGCAGCFKCYERCPIKAIQMVELPELLQPSTTETPRTGS